jgi:hypothetical protein
MSFLSAGLNLVKNVPGVGGFVEAGAKAFDGALKVAKGDLSGVKDMAFGGAEAFLNSNPITAPAMAIKNQIEKVTGFDPLDFVAGKVVDKFSGNTQSQVNDFFSMSEPEFDAAVDRGHFDNLDPYALASLAMNGLDDTFSSSSSGGGSFDSNGLVDPRLTTNNSYSNFGPTQSNGLVNPKSTTQTDYTPQFDADYKSTFHDRPKVDSRDLALKQRDQHLANFEAKMLLDNTVADIDVDDTENKLANTTKTSFAKAGANHAEALLNAMVGDSNERRDQSKRKL